MPIELDICNWWKSVPRRVLLREEVELVTREGVWQHNICACVEGEERKVDAKPEKCILVGYLDEQKGYQCYNP